MGLAKSLNYGIELSDGEYIARLDADDMAHPTRFQKQISYLDADLNIGICGSWQHHFGSCDDWIHKPSQNPAQCRANLLFTCDLCHSTLMFRRKLFIQNGLYYDAAFFAEDFELWTRAMLVTDIANLPEVLGEYRYEADGRTDTVLSELCKENGQIVAASFQRTLGITLLKEQYPLLNGWKNVFMEQKNQKIRDNMLKEYQLILRNTWDKNLLVGFFDHKSLLNTLRDRWIWARYDLHLEGESDIESIEQVFKKVKYPVWKRLKRFLRQNPSFALRLKKMVSRVTRLWEPQR